jgi:hypothetical protein
MHDRMVLYTAVTTYSTDAERLAFLQKNLKNQTILQNHQFALEIRTGDKTEDMYDMGNVNDMRKYISPRRKHV